MAKERQFTNGRMTPTELFEEIDWLMAGGVDHPERISEAVGRSLSALELLSRRHGRTDLALRFNAFRKSRSLSEDQRARKIALQRERRAEARRRA